MERGEEVRKPISSRLISFLSARAFRIDVGGKLLTNHLKEIISYRQWNMMDQTYVMDDVKEKCCFVSANFKTDMELSR